MGTSNQVNKITLVGSNRNILDGPSIICFGQNDNYPLYQQLNMDHDDIATGYDNYFDGSNYMRVVVMLVIKFVKISIN